MSLYTRWESQINEFVQNFSSTDSFNFNAGDSLDVQQFLRNVSGNTKDISLWEGTGLDPYGEKVKQIADDLGRQSENFLLESGGIPLGEAKITIEGEGRDAKFSLDWIDNSFRNIEQEVENLVADSGKKIPEKLAQYSGVSQVQGGGEFEVDRDIDDFDDALRSFGAGNVRFTKKTQESQESNKSMGTGNSNMIQNILQTARENKVLLAGAGIVAILVIE